MGPKIRTHWSVIVSAGGLHTPVRLIDRGTNGEFLSFFVPAVQSFVGSRPACPHPPLLQSSPIFTRTHSLPLFQPKSHLEETVIPVARYFPSFFQSSLPRRGHSLLIPKALILIHHLTTVYFPFNFANFLLAPAVILCNIPLCPLCPAWNSI